MDKYWEIFCNGGINELIHFCKIDIDKRYCEKALQRMPESTEKAIIESFMDVGQYQKAKRLLK